MFTALLVGGYFAALIATMTTKAVRDIRATNAHRNTH